MNSAVLLEQTAIHLTRQTQRWDRRRRSVSSLLWVPRAVIAGLVFGIVLALIARMRPWLLPEQIALITGIGMLLIVAGALGAIWLWPRSTAYQARYYDYRFGLKERISTALELSAGLIPLPAALAERQLSDAVEAARRVNVSARLPARVRVRELVLIVVLAALFAYLLLADNPQTDELLARRDLQQAIDEQAAAVEEAIQDIQDDPSLSEAEQQALTDLLAEALDILQQPDISQQEAVAALAEAAQSLQQMGNGMLSEQAAAYQNAASRLAGSDMTSNMAQALKRPDLGATAQALDDLANELGKQDLSEQERQDLAERLDQAADELAQTNPALAQKLREAAQALREGNVEAAQQALREAADLLREQQQRLQDSPLAEAAQAAMQQANQSQQALAQAGQQQAASEMNQGQQQAGQQQAQQQSGQQQGQQQPGQQQSQAEQPGQEGQQQAGEGSQPQQQSQSGEGQSESGQGQPGAEGQQPGETGQGQSQQMQGEGSQSQNQGSGEGQGPGQNESNQSQAGEGQSGASGEQAAGQTQSGQQGSTEGGANSPSSGEGDGGAGTDTTTGQVSEGGEIPANNAAPGGFEEYNPVYAPSTIGGQSDDVIDVGGQSTTPDGQPIREGDFGPNPGGQSSLSYTGVYSNYQGIISDALESGRIPLDQRDVIHDYFSSLER